MILRSVLVCPSAGAPDDHKLVNEVFFWLETLCDVRKFSVERLVNASTHW